MKVALIGYEIEGRAAYSYWHARGADITICDMDLDKVVPAGVSTQLGEHYLDELDRFDIIVRSAGIHPNVIIEPNPGVKDKITTIIEEFSRVSPTTHIIGITGTKGKGTTSTLTAKMLQAAGKQVHLGGNIGAPPLDFLDALTSDSWVVLELSSFQLYDLHRSTAIAVCLMMGIDHLNWHGDVRDYHTAKSHLFDYQTANDLAIYFADNEKSKEIAAHGLGRKLPYYAPPGAYVDDGNILINGQVICRTKDLKLIGTHNWQNACASATIAWEITKDIAPIREVLLSFTGLEHRLEFVRKVDQVSYYNDSYASAPDSAMAALDAVPGMKVMILGGFDRGLPLKPLAEVIRDHDSVIRKAVIIGASRERLASELTRSGFSNFILESSRSMEDIVNVAKEVAEPDDSILLSPGFASFDMFKNFTDRGLQFKSVVEQL
jgi:UDP-N-acetylmuramoylalanine--D-glutamate ligase